MYKEYSEEFIQQLLDKVDLKEYISRYVEIKQKGKYNFGVCPFHSENTASFSVSDDNWHCYGCNKSGNLITFIMEHHHLSYPQAIEYLSNYTGIKEHEIKPTPATIKFLKEFNRKKKLEKVEHIILPKNIMNNYSKEPILEWIFEGIEQDVMDKYQVRMDHSSYRIVFPIWDNDGNIINVKGRTTIENYKELGMSKYIYYYPLGCNDFLYPLHFKKDIIKESGEVILFEGSKSVLKCESWGIENCLSLETSNINDFQVKNLLKLHKNVVFALDKGINLNKIYDKISILKKFTNVYAIVDKNCLLDDKDAPCDKGIDIFLELHKHKIKL